MTGPAYRLKQRIAVIELLQGSEEQLRLGNITFLPEGVEVEICGPGFNPRTVRVCHADRYYFAFEDQVTGGAPTARRAGGAA
jgi:hypothetical protein